MACLDAHLYEIEYSIYNLNVLLRMPRKVDIY
jgi:hypothetical protein